MPWRALSVWLLGWGTSGILFSLFVLTGCCTPWHGPAVVTTPTGSRICAKHRIPLVTVDGYQIHTEPNECIDPDSDKVEHVKLCYPNAIPWYESLTSFNGHGDPAKITYCPLCERGAQRITK